MVGISPFHTMGSFKPEFTYLVVVLFYIVYRLGRIRSEKINCLADKKEL